MLFINIFTAIMLWLSACSGAIEPGPTDPPPDTVTTPEPAGNRAPERKPADPLVYYYITVVDHPIGMPDPTYGVLSGMVDPDGNPMTAVLDSLPIHGTLAFHSDGTWLYTPEPGFTGGAEFWFHATDGWKNSASTYVDILVDAKPVAHPDVFTVQAGDSVLMRTADILGNDADRNDDPMTPFFTDPPLHGRITPVEDGYWYVPDAGFTGTEVLNYYDEESIEGGAVSNITTITVTVSEH